MLFYLLVLELCNCVQVLLFFLLIFCLNVLDFEDVVYMFLELLKVMKFLLLLEFLDTNLVSLSFFFVQTRFNPPDQPVT